MRQRVKREGGKEKGRQQRYRHTERQRDVRQTQVGILIIKWEVSITHQGLGNPTEEEAERVLEPEGTGDNKKTKPFKTRSYKNSGFQLSECCNPFVQILMLW